VLILLGIAEVTKNIWFVAAAVAFVFLVTWLAILPEGATSSASSARLSRLQGEVARWF